MQLYQYIHHQLAKVLQRFESLILGQSWFQGVTLHCFARLIYIRIECKHNPLFAYLNEKDAKLLKHLQHRLGIELTKCTSRVLETLLEIPIIDQGFSFAEGANDIAIFSVLESAIDSSHPLSSLVQHQEFPQLKQPITKLYVAHHKKYFRKGPRQVGIYTGDNFVLVHAHTDNPLYSQIKALNVNACMAVAAFYNDTVRNELLNLQRTLSNSMDLFDHMYFSAISHRGDSVFLVCEFSKQLTEIAQLIPANVRLSDLLTTPVNH